MGWVGLRRAVLPWVALVISASLQGKQSAVVTPSRVDGMMGYDDILVTAESAKTERRTYRYISTRSSQSRCVRCVCPLGFGKNRTALKSIPGCVFLVCSTVG